MNIYEKIQKAKIILGQTEIKKSGHNKFADFKYYELSDFMPEITHIFNDLNLFSKTTFTDELATLVIINSEKPEEREEYTSPMRTLELKGTNAMQALGSVETYQRRYLYMSALDITENDVIDAVNHNQKKDNAEYKCEDCGKLFEPFEWKGKSYTAQDGHNISKNKNGRPLCKKCADS